MMTHPNYPARQEVDAWCDAILERAAKAVIEPKVEKWTFGTEAHVGARGNDKECLLEFPSAGGGTFHCLWQPALSGPGPVLFHLPGYGAEFSAHPELVAAGFHVMHINPLGYNTPWGWPAGVDKNNPLASLRPVFPDTVTSFGEKGYIHWLTDSCAAVRWARAQPGVQPERFGFFGTSQGGGTSLLLGSIHAGEGCRAVAADQAFMINFPQFLAREPENGWLKQVFNAIPETDHAKAWHTLGLIDNLCHVHRLMMPIFLGSGTADTILPPELIKTLFEELQGTRSFVVLKDQRHGYSNVFKQLAAAWFRCYV
jgi:cephalosporin-C deacetylase-like acetyl esterase